MNAMFIQLPPELMQVVAFRAGLVTTLAMRQTCKYLHCVLSEPSFVRCFVYRTTDILETSVKVTTILSPGDVLLYGLRPSAKDVIQTSARARCDSACDLRNDSTADTDNLYIVRKMRGEEIVFLDHVSSIEEYQTTVEFNMTMSGRVESTYTKSMMDLIDIVSLESGNGTISSPFTVCTCGSVSRIQQKMVDRFPSLKQLQEYMLTSSPSSPTTTVPFVVPTVYQSDDLCRLCRSYDERIVSGSINIPILDQSMGPLALPNHPQTLNAYSSYKIYEQHVELVYQFSGNDWRRLQVIVQSTSASTLEWNDRFHTWITPEYSITLNGVTLTQQHKETIARFCEII